MLLRCWRDERGNMAILFALMLPVVGVAVGATVDYADLARKKTELQLAADSAAIAGARDMMDNGGLPPGQLKQHVENITNQFIQSQAPGSTGNVQVSITGYNGGTENSVSVSLSQAKPLNFAGWLGIGSASLVATSAKAVPGSNPVGACVIALDPSTTKSFLVSGNGTVSVPNCGIYVNSSARNALSQMGASRLKAASIQVVGNYSGSNYSPMPKANQPAIADPLASIPEPSPPAGCSYSGTFNVPITFPAGSTYCGAVAFNANVTFSPGNHYFKSATVTTGSNVNIVGNGVMLYFDQNSSFASTSSGQVSLTAPQSGTYVGIVMFGSRSAAVPTFKLTGSKDYFVNGTIYLPKANLELYGSVDLSVTSKNGYIIAYQFLYQGDSSLVMDTFGGAAPSALAAKPLALVQ